MGLPFGPWRPLRRTLRIIRIARGPSKRMVSAAIFFFFQTVCNLEKECIGYHEASLYNKKRNHNMMRRTYCCCHT